MIRILLRSSSKVALRVGMAAVLCAVAVGSPAQAPDMPPILDAPATAEQVALAAPAELAPEPISAAAEVWPPVPGAIEPLIPPFPDDGPAHTGAIASEPQPHGAAAPAPQRPAMSEMPLDGSDSAEGDDALAYCRNIADAAADARFARQAQALTALQAEIEERTARLEEKRAEFEEWMARREAFMRKADESVVAIFTQMRPDAASLQMAVMEDAAAAAILAKLNPRIASAILNEMDPGRAAQLTNAMAGLAKKSDDEGTSG